jgi:hypothetical protein
MDSKIPTEAQVHAHAFVPSSSKPGRTSTFITGSSQGTGVIEGFCTSVRGAVLKKFEELRARLSHSLLRTGVLDRLGVTAEFYSLNEPRQKEMLLVKTLLQIDRIRDNHRRAIEAWRGEKGYEPGVRATVDELLRAAYSMKSCQPSGQFPSKKEVLCWIDAMEKFLETIAADRQQMAQEFAKYAVRVIDFVHDLDVDSGMFWRYFDPKVSL